MSTKNGMFLRKANPTNIKEALWWESHCVRRQGGYDFDASNLPADFRWLAKGFVLGFNASTGKAYVIKTAKVTTAAEANATTLLIEENPLIKVGDKLAGSTISAITTTDGISTLTVSALANAVAKDAVVDAMESDTIVLGLNYDTVDLFENDFPQVTATLQCYEIEEDSMPQAISPAIKSALGPLHQFKIQ